MRLDRDPDGDFVIEAEPLAARLGLSPDAMKRKMRLGQVTSLVERGTEAEHGLIRLTVRCGRLTWRAVVDSTGAVRHESTEALPAEPELVTLVRAATADPSQAS